MNLHLPFVESQARIVPRRATRLSRERLISPRISPLGWARRAYLAPAAAKTTNPGLFRAASAFAPVQIIDLSFGCGINHAASTAETH